MISLLVGQNEPNGRYHMQHALAVLYYRWNKNTFHIDTDGRPTAVVHLNIQIYKDVSHQPHKRPLRQLKSAILHSTDLALWDNMSIGHPNLGVHIE